MYILKWYSYKRQLITAHPPLSHHNIIYTTKAFFYTEYCGGVGLGITF